MEQTLAIKGRGRVSREEIIKIQEEANRKAMTVRRVRTGIRLLPILLLLSTPKGILPDQCLRIYS